MLKTSDEDAAYSGKQQRELAINRDNLTKEQRQRIKKMNAQRKKKNADRKKKKEEEKQPHTSGLLQAKPSSKNDDKKPSSKNDDKNENMKPNTSGSLQAKPSKNDDKNENMQPNTSGLLQAKPSSKNDDNNDNGTQTDGKFSFTIPPSDKPKPQAASGSFSAYEPGKSMADEFVSALAQAFVAEGGGSSNGEGEIQEASAAVATYTITTGSLVSTLRDTSTQIDGFEKPSTLSWSFPEKYPWETTKDVSYEGKSSIKSGLPPSSANVVVGKSIYSNMTLSLDNDVLNQAVGKDGGGAVLSFQVKATEALSWPISAFMVTLNDEIVLSPSDVESASTVWKENGWAEFSIAIDTAYSYSANYDVKFIHVANPLQLDKLPSISAALELFVDDVRLAPFTRKNDPLDMTTDGSNGARWKDVSGVFVATSDSIGQETGYADLTFVVYTKLGGTLKYELKSSTQGPFDDVAILFNGKLHDAQFGQSANFDFIQVVLPRGKTVVKFRHRKNPGQLGSKILEGLGSVKTVGTNRLKNIEVWARE
jgi:hypothetical protein